MWPKSKQHAVETVQPRVTPTLCHAVPCPAYVYSKQCRVQIRPSLTSIECVFSAADGSLVHREGCNQTET